MLTVYDDIAALNGEVLETADMPPHRRMEVLVEYTAHYALLTTEARESDIAFKAVLWECYRLEKAASRAKLRAENSDAYRRARLAKDTLKVVEEMIRSQKMVLKTQQEEMRLAR